MSSKFASRLTAGPTFSLMAGCAVAALAYAPSAAQTASSAPAVRAEAPSDNEVEEVVVNGTRVQRGAVVGDIAPEIQLTPRDIRAYGVSSISELVDALAPQTSSARGSGGRPVVLINGARTSGFAEVRDIPTEAIARVDILPEEVSLKYGYPADQRVINIVLRQRFHAITSEAGYTTPTQGRDGDTTTAHVNLLHIRREQRLQLDLKASKDTAILESDRNLIGRSDGAFRTLKPEGRDVTANAVLTKPLGKGVSATLNGTLEASDSDGRLGLSPFTSTALERHSETVDGHLGAVVNGAYSGWRWSYTGSADRNDVHTTTQRVFGGVAFTDRSRAISNSASSDLVLNRSLFRLPAGPVAATFAGKVSVQDYGSDSLRSGVRRSADLTRGSGRLQASLDMPVTRRGPVIGAGIGDISTNLNLAVENLSDFGALVTVGGGVNWTPIKPVRMILSFTQEDQAPTVQQLGDPEAATPGVRVFDLKRGETADITRIDGGSPGLNSSQRQVIKLGMTFKPFDATNLTFTANYIGSRTRDAIAAFPSASTQVEDAFPSRFLRDAQGRLIQIDARPVNFQSQDRDELRWGFTFVKQMPAQRPAGAGTGAAGGSRQARPDGGEPPVGGPPPENAAPGPGGDRPGGFAGGFGGGPGGPGGPGGFGGFGGGRGGPGGGVFQLGLYHTVAFRDEIVVRSGVPTLDLLDGAAIGSGGGSPRHQVDLQANLSRNGLGASLNGKWQSGTTVRSATGAGGGSLDFSDLATLNIRLFADLGLQKFAQGRPWLRGARASFAVNNLFDSRQQVRTATGTTPVSYQPDSLDPVGRSVKFSVRKLLF